MLHQRIRVRAEEIRNKKIDVLRAIRPIPPEHVDRLAVRGQYGAGWIDNKPVPAGLNLRHPDFARFAVKIGRAIGREEQIVSALQIAEKDKSLFCLENDFIGAAVLDYLDETGTFTGTAAELRTKLSERDLGFIRKDRPSAKGVGKRLRTLWPHFENILTVARQEEDRNHFKIYTLKSKSADFADFV